MRLIKHFAYCLLLPAGIVMAEVPRQECLGRLTFDVPEAIEWATYDAGRTFRISTGGGHNFSSKVTAKGDLSAYDYHGLVVYVSDVVERSEFDSAARYRKGTGSLYQDELREDIKIKRFRLSEFPGMGYSQEVIASLQEEIEELEKKVPLAEVIEHDLGIPDAYFLGGQIAPTEAYLYRNQRVYYFSMGKADRNSAEYFKDLVSRFQPRALYEVPEGPGICMPYGFIADDGKTAYSIKNSLRFTSTPNVIFRIVTASAKDPWGTKPTIGTYNTDYRPGYDGSKWRKTKFIEPTYIGDRLAGMDGWLLEPKPDSGEQERAWFGLAHTGGTFSPMIAIQVFTFQQGTDDLTELTPPPEKVLPRWKELSKTIRPTLE
ncbi:hypothetical protein LCGC14_0763040 [marine sediment metagenome]|uniref:Uncharacterized protein n=2 Tax=root TaxID=1 RepID=A0A0F9Q0Q5_9ZZZZ